MEVWKDKYNLVNQLSRKQSVRFGETFQLEDKSTKEAVIFKVVEKPNVVGLQQLKSESTFSFSQNGLPEIFEVFENESHFGFYKRFESGSTFDQYWSTVKKSKRKEKLKEIISNLAPLFNTLEDHNIVHGDIKPENIIVLENQGQISCSLIDFGLAFRTNDLPTRKTLFQLGYASPELILNRLDCADKSTDLFSLCLVIFKLWTGKLPFSSPNPAMMTQLQITYPIEKTWKIPKNLWKVLEKGLVKHRFKVPANKMTQEEVKIALNHANQLRFVDFNAFQNAIENL